MIHMCVLKEVLVLDMTFVTVLRVILGSFVKITTVLGSLISHQESAQAMGIAPV